MKTVRKNEEVRRVTDKTAESLMIPQGWSYCPKSVYKDSKKGKKP